MSVSQCILRVKRLVAARLANASHRQRLSLATASIVERLEGRQLLSAVTTWASRGPGGGGAFFSPSFSPFNPNEIYTVSDMSGLYHSTNLGQSWSVADFRQIQGGIGSQVQFTSDPNILYTLDYSNTAGGGSSTTPSKSTDGGKTWKQVPGWNGSNNGAFSLYADPASTTRLLATDYGHLYFSNDGDQSFKLVYTDPSSGQGCYVGGVFWDGQNIYVGTDSGLVQSTNGGTSFASANVGGLPAGSSILSFSGAKQNNVTKLVCITANSGDVYGGLETGSIGSGSFSGIWTLTPGQSTWTKSSTVPAHDGPLIVSMARNDINTIYVGGTDYNTSFPIVAKSTDGGQTFADVLNVVNNGNVATGWQGAGGDRQWTFDQLTEGFEVSPNNPNDIAFTGYGYLHLSTDGGTTWHQAYVNPADQNPAGSSTPQNKPYHGVGLEDTSAITLAWANAQTILAGYTDINGVRSTNGGQSWSFPAGITLAGNTVYSIARQGSIFYAATSNTHDIYQSTHVLDSRIDGGKGNIIFSTDNGETWNVLHSFGAPVVGVAADPNDPTRLYASVASSTIGGIYTTTNIAAGAGATWTKLASPPRTQGHAFNITVLNDGSVVATFSGRRVGSSFTDSSGVFISSDHGAIWLDRTGMGMHWWTKDITIDPTDPNQSTWYASVRFAYGTSGAANTGGLYRTTDRGQNWQQILQVIGAESAAVNPTNGELYCATEENGLLFSANPKAASPTFAPTTYPFRQPERVYFNPFNPNEVWVTSFGYGLMVGSTGVNTNIASISGNVFNDINSDGTLDGNDAGLANITVYIDANTDGSFDSGDTSTMTDGSGNYTFSNLAAGTYRIRELLPSGDTLTAPPTGFYDVPVATGQTVSGKIFGTHQPAAAPGSISGDVYVDANGNGAEDTGETYLSGVQVYIDANHNGMMDLGETVVSSTPAGTYTFANLPAGNYRIGEVVPSGYALTQPAAGFYDVALAAGQNADDDFGNHPNAGAGIIRGSIFNDIDGNMVQTTGEPYLQGWTAYIDKNLDGMFDTGDIPAMTASNGYFTFQGLAPGNYRIREVIQSGWTQTRPTAGYYDVTLAAGQTVNDRIFGNRQNAVVKTGSLSGIVFNDLNANGKQDAGETKLAGWTVFLDTNNDGKLEDGESSTLTNSEGNYSFPNVAPGNYHVAEVVKTGWRRTAPGTAGTTVTVSAGANATGPMFGNTNRVVILGSVLNVANQKGLAGFRVYIQETTAAGYVSSDPSFVTNYYGHFVFVLNAVTASTTYIIRVVPQNGYALSSPSAGFIKITIGPAGISSGSVFAEKAVG